MASTATVTAVSAQCALPASEKLRGQEPAAAAT